MRVLVTNDDGVHAPGLGALTRALAAWCWAAPSEEEREVVVVAPLANQSGASAAVGTVYEREAIAYQAVAIDGAEDVPTFGIDASPALSVIVSALGGFGPRPDVVVSGINHGVNVGRSILHSGTVGAILTGSQFGLSGIAVSMRSGGQPMPWETAADLAVALLAPLRGAVAPTLWNLNVPHLAPADLRGVRKGRIGPAGLLKAASDPLRAGGPGTADHVGNQQVRGSPIGTMEPGEEGALAIQLGAAVPTLGDVGDEDPVDDGALVAAGYASVTPLRSVSEVTGAATWGAPDADPLAAGLADLDALLRVRATVR